jgi:hypothetical protein
MAACDHCHGQVGKRGHRCQGGMCIGTYHRAKAILAAGVDINGDPIGHDQFRKMLEYSIKTKAQRR